MYDKVYCCTTFRKYDYLTNKGFEVKYSRKDIKDAKKTVWFFIDSPELQEAVNYYYAHYDEISKSLTVK